MKRDVCTLTSGFAATPLPEPAVLLKSLETRGDAAEVPDTPGGRGEGVFPEQTHRSLHGSLPIIIVNHYLVTKLVSPKTQWGTTVAFFAVKTRGHRFLLYQKIDPKKKYKK